MLSYLLRFSTKLLLSVSLFTGIAHSAVDPNVEMECPVEFQANGLKADGTISDYKKLWTCPALPNFNKGGDYTLTHELANANFETGSYTCIYRHKDSGQRAQSCKFKSGAYAKMQQDIHITLYGDKTGATPSKGVFSLGYGDAYDGNKIDFAKDFNKIGVAVPSYITGDIQAELNNAHKVLKDKTLLFMKNDHELVNVENSLSSIKEISYKHLVEPYYSPDVKDALKKEETFSNFLAGLVTLNDEFIEGYNEDTGELTINQEWKTKATSVTQQEESLLSAITSKVVGFFDSIYSVLSGDLSGNEMAEKAENKEGLYASEYLMNVSSWVDIFELKIWGYYYNLQRRLDIGYDVISTQLLYIMSIWFILMAGGRAWIGNIINREQGVKSTEENWFKALSMILGVGIFYISLSSPVTSTGSGGIQGASEITQEMNKNKTIMKYVIRTTSNMGANFATMLSDLGLDAFLSYVVSAQNVYSVSGIARTFQSDVATMSMYFPALDTVNQCRSYYNTTDKEFYSSAAGTLNTNQAWKDTAYAKSNNISMMSYDLCKKAYTIVGAAPYEMTVAAKEAISRIDNVDEVMAKAVEQLTVNHILVQDKMGWVNTFNVPVTYFMMKYNDMFLTTDIDYERIEDEAKSTVANLGVKDGHDTFDGSETSTVSNYFRVGWGGLQDNVQGLAGTATGWVSGFMLYNILPAFSSMRSGIQSHLDKIYTDYQDKENAKKIAKAVKGKGNDKSIKERAAHKMKIFLRSIKMLGKFKAVSGFIKKGLSSAVESPAIMRTLIVAMSFMMALYVWQKMFAIILISSIAIMLLLKTVLYFKDLMVHVITSVFLVAWAFAKQGGQGEAKMVNFARDTLVLMIYPSLIVLGGFIFIFIFEFFEVVYTFLMNIMLEGQKATISLMTTANSDTNTFSAYMNVASLQQLSEILVSMFGLFIALSTIMKFPEYVLKKFGINENESMMLSSQSQEIGQKGDKFANPLQ